PGAAFAEESDVAAILLVELDLKIPGLAGIFFRQPLKGCAVGFTVTNVDIVVNGFPIPDEAELLAHEGDVERLPLARRLREVLLRHGPLVERATVVERGGLHAKAIEDLDLEQAAVVDARVAPLGHSELDVQLIVTEVFVGHDVRPPAIIAAK